MNSLKAKKSYRNRPQKTIKRIEKKYKIKLPPQPIKTIYDPETDVLYIEYRKITGKIGEPTKTAKP